MRVGLRGRGGRIAAYIRLPAQVTEYVLSERALLSLARRAGWEYVRFFRDRHNTTDGWESLLAALGRGEILGLCMMSLEDLDVDERSRFCSLALKQGVRVLTVTESLDSWTYAGREYLLALLRG